MKSSKLTLATTVLLLAACDVLERSYGHQQHKPEAPRPMRISAFTSTILSTFTALSLSLGACVVAEDPIDRTEDSELEEVINTNTIVDGGRAILHAFESDDMIASVEIAPSDVGLSAIYVIETSVDYYSTTVEYEIRDGQFVLMDLDKAVASSEELQSRLAGTEIERYLKNGDFDLTAGIDASEMESFRSGCGWLWLAMVGACGMTIAVGILTLFTAAPAVIYTVTGASGTCIAAATAWSYCRVTNG